MTQPCRRLALLYTSFPVRSETFVQREFVAIADLWDEVEAWSLHRGEPSHEGRPVRRFSKWNLWRLVYRLPCEWVSRPRLFFELLHLLLTRVNPPSSLNLGENLLGIGFAIIEAPHFRRSKPDLIHGVWGSLPAMAAWMLSRLCHIPYSFEAHAYDLYEHGGDWFLREKIRSAALIRTSTLAGVARLQALGAADGQVVLIRRGLLVLPDCRERLPVRVPVRFLTVGRLVEKKGFLRQMEILAALRDAGVAFSARLIGEGQQREAIEHSIDSLGLADSVSLAGWLPVEEVVELMGQSDILLHTGQVARCGDRDGLPNVVGEAMSAGAIVISTPEDGVSEAVVDGETGFLCSLDDASLWIAAVRRILERPDEVFGIRSRARSWVEREFDARANMRRWFERTNEINFEVPGNGGLF